jgi:hypothetical protein
VPAREEGDCDITRPPPRGLPKARGNHAIELCDLPVPIDSIPHGTVRQESDEGRGRRQRTPPPRDQSAGPEDAQQTRCRTHAHLSRHHMARPRAVVNGRHHGTAENAARMDTKRARLGTRAPRRPGPRARRRRPRPSSTSTRSSSSPAEASAELHVDQVLELAGGGLGRAPRRPGPRARRRSHGAALSAEPCSAAPVRVFALRSACFHTAHPFARQSCPSTRSSSSPAEASAELHVDQVLELAGGLLWTLRARH